MSAIHQTKCDGCGKTRKGPVGHDDQEARTQAIGWLKVTMESQNEHGFRGDFTGDFCSLECMNKNLKMEMFKAP